MYFAAVALVGASFGQPPAMPIPTAAPIVQEHQEYQDHKFLAERLIKLPIKYEKDRKAIRQVLLFVARNGENLWSQEAAVTPDRDFFLYTAKEDGVYWFTMVIEDLQGRRDPADMTRIPPDLKVIVDTVKPRVQFTQANRSGDTIVIEWFVSDKYPDDNATKVQFKALNAPENAWKTVSLPATSKSGVRFQTGTSEPVIVRVTAYDMASNKTEATYQFGPGVANSQVSTNTAPPAPMVGTPPPAFPPAPVVAPPNYNTSSTVIPPPDMFAPVPPPPPPSVPAISPIVPPAPSQTQGSGTPSVLQPAFNPTPYTPSVTLSGFGSPAGGSTIPSAPTVSPGPMSPVAPPVVQPSPMVPAPTIPATSTPAATTGVGSGVGNTLSTQTLPVFDPRAVVPAAQQGNGSAGGPTPVAVWSGPPTTTPTVEVTRTNAINYLTFDVGYELESHGPSGISRVDLWVTRDDGRSWLKWSQHDGKGSSLRVNLNVPANPQPEGTYGFRVVPVSGAGLSEREPIAGDAPDLRVVVDITPPQLDLFPPVSDPTSPDTLVIQWKATDKNFMDDPITIEWSDKPTGPWQPVATGGDVVQAVSGTTPVLRRLPNTGQFAWRVPAGLSPRVYLKVCARDAAGNVREVITRDPVLVDLVKPRAKISGIVPPPVLLLSKP